MVSPLRLVPLRRSTSPRVSALRSQGLERSGTSTAGWSPTHSAKTSVAVKPATPAKVASTTAPVLKAQPRTGVGLYHSLNDLADRLGAVMTHAGSSLEQAATSFGRSSELGSRTLALSGAVSAFGAGLASAPEHTVAMANAVYETATSLANRAEGVLLDASEGAQSGLTALKQGVDSLHRGAADYVEGVKQAVDYTQNISKLGKGDSYTLGVLGYVGVEGVRAQGTGSVTVNRVADGSFTVVTDGELAAGLFVELGGSVAGHGATANLSASLVGGGALEFSFATADEASRAVAALMSPVARTDAQSAYLSSHRSAIELRGGASALAWGLLGLKGHASLYGNAEGQGLASVRIERGVAGAPLQLVIQEKVRANLDAQGAFDASFFATLGGANATTELLAEQRYTLPATVALAEVTKNPFEVLSASRETLLKTRSESVTMSAVGEAHVMGTGAGGRAQFTIKGSLRDVMSSAAVGRALRGDFRGALASLPPHLKVEGVLAKSQSTGVRTGPWFSVMGFGVGVELDATRVDVLDQSVRRFEGSGAQVAAALH